MLWNSSLRYNCVPVIVIYVLTVLRKKQYVAEKGTGKPQNAEREFSNTNLCAHTNLKQEKIILDCFISVSKCWQG